MSYGIEEQMATNSRIAPLGNLEAIEAILAILVFWSLPLV